MTVTTSSYAVLALLNLKPWTGYELTRQAQRSLRYAWPKSERLLYSEPKKLVELGYATVHQEDNGHRTRNVYTIAPEKAAKPSTGGRARPHAPFRGGGLVEAPLRRPRLTRRRAQSPRRVQRADIGAHHQAIVELMGSYLDGGHPFPQRTHLSVLFATFQIDMFKTIERSISSREQKSMNGQPPETFGTI